MPSPDQWLIRTSQNVILGPYSKNEICEMIGEGSLGVQDEVCQANQFWFYLHERDEVQRQLGMDVPNASLISDDEATLTQTETINVLTAAQEQFGDTEQTAMFTRSAAAGGADSAASSAGHAGGGSSAVSSVVTPVRRPELKIPKRENVFVIGQMEKVSFWRGVVWALLFLIVVLAGVVVLILRTADAG
jgi:hypothetical protein